MRFALRVLGSERKSRELDGRKLREECKKFGTIGAIVVVIVWVFGWCTCILYGNKLNFHSPERKNVLNVV